MSRMLRPVDKYAIGAALLYAMGASVFTWVGVQGEWNGLAWFAALQAVASSAAWIRTSLGSLSVVGSGIGGFFWGHRPLDIAEVRRWKIVDNPPLYKSGSVLVVWPVDTTLIVRSPSFFQLRPGVPLGGLVGYIRADRRDAIRDVLARSS